MPKVCHVCGKKRVVGGHITRRGMPKKQGGIGTHVVKDVKRVFKPNLQSIRIREGTKVVHAQVCTKCIRAGSIKKA